MCLRCLSLLVCLPFAVLTAAPPALRVCADPNNLPFSNTHGDGFENKLAELLAAKVGAKLQYTWWAQRRSFIKNSLEAGRCDVIMGVPASIASVITTKPYYRSSYVFVTRHDRNLHLASLGDPRLAQWRIGVHEVGNDLAPPAAALARRGITKNVTGYSLFGRYGEDNPPRTLIDAVAHNGVDVAIVWGPFAGYFAKQEDVPLDVVPVSPSMFLAIPFTYDISAAVRKDEPELKTQLDAVIQNDAAAIRQILDGYGVPQVN